MSIIVLTVLYYLPLFACKYCFFIELGAPYGQRPTLGFSVLSFRLSPLKRRKGWSGLKIKDVFPHSKALRTVVINLLGVSLLFCTKQLSFFFQTSFIEAIPEKYPLEVCNSASLVYLELCGCHYHLIPQHFYHPRKQPCV